MLKSVMVVGMVLAMSGVAFANGSHRSGQVSVTSTHGGQGSGVGVKATKNGFASGSAGSEVSTLGGNVGGLQGTVVSGSSGSNAVAGVSGKGSASSVSGGGFFGNVNVFNQKF